MIKSRLDNTEDFLVAQRVTKKFKIKDKSRTELSRRRRGAGSLLRYDNHLQLESSEGGLPSTMNPGFTTMIVNHSSFALLLKKEFDSFWADSLIDFKNPKMEDSS